MWKGPEVWKVLEGTEEECCGGWYPHVVGGWGVEQVGGAQRGWVVLQPFWVVPSLPLLLYQESPAPQDRPSEAREDRDLLNPGLSLDQAPPAASGRGGQQGGRTPAALPFSSGLGDN